MGRECKEGREPFGNGDGRGPQEWIAGVNGISIHQNPFNPTTRVSYTMPEAGRVKIVLYNIVGEVVRTIADEDQTDDSHPQSFTASTPTVLCRADGLRKVLTTSAITPAERTSMRRSVTMSR